MKLLATFSGLGNYLVLKLFVIDGESHRYI